MSSVPLLEESQQHALCDVTEMLMDLRSLVAAHGEFLAKFGGDSRLRLEPPRFDGENAPDWIRKIQQYYNHHNTPLDDRIYLAQYLFDHPASDWMAYWTDNNPDKGWEDFLVAVYHRFTPELLEGDSHMVDDVHQSEHIVDAPKEVTLDPSIPDAAPVFCGMEEVVFDDLNNVSLVQQTRRSIVDEPSFEFCPKKENLHNVDDSELFRLEQPAIPHQLTAFATDTHSIPPCNDTLHLGKNTTIGWRLPPDRTTCYCRAATAPATDSLLSRISTAVTNMQPLLRVTSAAAAAPNMRNSHKLAENSTGYARKSRSGHEVSLSRPRREPRAFRRHSNTDIKWHVSSTLSIASTRWEREILLFGEKKGVRIFDPGDFKSINYGAFEWEYDKPFYVTNVVFHIWGFSSVANQCSHYLRANVRIGECFADLHDIMTQRDDLGVNIIFDYRRRRRDLYCAGSIFLMDNSKSFFGIRIFGCKHGSFPVDHFYSDFHCRIDDELLFLFHFPP